MNSVERTFDPHMAEVTAARHFARAVVIEWGLVADDVALVVTELAANAVRHAPGRFQVSLQRLDDAVLVEVTDTSAFCRVPADRTRTPWTGGDSS